jgi:hypothetical protein
MWSVLAEVSNHEVFGLADSSAARHGRAALAKNWTGPCLEANIGEKQIGVFFRAAPPRALRGAEVDSHIGSDSEVLVLGQLDRPQT